MTLRPEIPEASGRGQPRRRWVVVVAIVAVAAALDQITKAMAQAWLPPHTLQLLGDTVRLALSENVGAFLSLGASLSPALRFWIFTVASGGMLLIVALYLVSSDELPPDVVVALSFVVGGGVGNLIDRITREGRVVDFLNFGIGNLRTGILNVADIFITVGALYVLWSALRSGHEDK